jgi:hypothetical protein
VLKKLKMQDNITHDFAIVNVQLTINTTLNMGLTICVCYQFDGLETDSGVIINPKAGQVDHFLKSDI